MSRHHVVGAAAILSISAAAASCDDTPVAAQPLATFGPESLHVAFLRAPDTLGMAGEFSVSLVARNRTRGQVMLLSPCAARGFRLRLLGPGGYARDLPPSGCAAGAADGAQRLASGDSLVATLTSADVGVKGAFRLEASYAVNDAQSAVVGRPLLVLTALSCSANDARIAFALNVGVVDAVTRVSLPAMVVATAGEFREVLQPGPGSPNGAGPGSYFGVRERPGVYTVTVAATSYQPWKQENVAVARGADCHVQMANLLAELVR